KNKKKIIQKLEEKYPKGKISHLDGLTVEFDDWWFNVRPSNTEPLLRLNLEAKTEEAMKKRIKEIENFINNN
ncbi:phosphomannomutase/phosphoglucomutase, partial [bacterium]